MKPDDLPKIEELQRELESAWRDVETAQVELDQAKDRVRHAREYVMTLLTELEEITEGAGHESN